MKTLYNLLITTLFLGISATSYAQNGTIRGTVIEASTGEPLIGVNVLVKGTTRGASTDVDGNFSINTAPGTYELRISYVSFQTKNITGVSVKADEVTVLSTIPLEQSNEELEEVVVTASALNDTEAALITKKRNLPNMIDGISSETFTKTGLSKASEALKKVTGVSVEGGKYVYVRGLGDRYTKTMLNSVEIPSLDPNKNSLQVDIFPTSIIGNMIISKTAVASMPADFTGGIVNIETKSFPVAPIFEISASIGYNPEMHFQSDFLTYPGSDTDFLGFDHGARNLPDGAGDSDYPTPGSTPDENIYNFVNQYNPVLGPTENQNMMNYSIGATLGNQYDVGGNTLGYIFSANYKKNKNHYQNYQFGDFLNQSAPTAYDLVYATRQNGTISEENVLLAGLAGIAFKTPQSRYKLTGMRLQNGESRASSLFIDNSESAAGQSGYKANSYNLDYSQRSITNVLLRGTHFFDDARWEIGWTLSPTFSNIEDPDVRNTTYTLPRLEGNPVTFNAGAGGFPIRLWRFMEEVNLDANVDVNREYQLFGQIANFKFGGGYVYKQRDYEILSSIMSFRGSPPSFSDDPDPNDLLNDGNIIGRGGSIYYQSANPDPNPNAYKSNVNSMAAYISNEFFVTPKLQAIVGLRAENYVLRHTGRDIQFAQGNASGNNLDNEKVLEGLDLFPSVNMTYSLSDAMNLRFSYSRTIARPTFKELSFAQIIDPISNRTFNGGLFEIGNWDGNLHETNINNFDLRWEMFFNRGQLLSASVFYKTFNDPIELVRIQSALTNTNYQPRNVGDGQVYGAEFEIRKSLGFISSTFQNLNISGNLTIVQSFIEMTDQEFEARQRFEKAGQDLDDTRRMAGQAPYIVNVGLSYDNPSAGFNAGLFYNLKGETLLIVGGGLFPDVYSKPFHNLNFNLNKSFGPASISLNISNILNDIQEESYKAYRAEDQIYSRYKPHRSVSLGIKYRF